MVKMSRRTKMQKGLSKERKATARRREGTYYLPYKNVSAGGIEYTNYSPSKPIKLPRKQVSLGLWDAFIKV